MKKPYLIGIIGLIFVAGASLFVSRQSGVVGSWEVVDFTLEVISTPPYQQIDSASSIRPSSKIGYNISYERIGSFFGVVVSADFLDLAGACARMGWQHKTFSNGSGAAAE